MGSYYEQIYKIETVHANDIKEKNKEIDELAQALSIATCEKGELLKYKKAFNLLKDKKVDIPLFIRCSNLEDYNGICPVDGSPQLNQEEFDFLREMLRDE